MTQRNLPPLEVDTAYRIQGFESFDYDHLFQSEGKAILRLRLKNRTTLELPATDDQLKLLAVLLAEAFGPHVIAHLKTNGRV